MGRKKKKFKPIVFCYYCDRTFENEKVLIQHQRAKHFKCVVCHKRLGSAHGMMVHVFQVHKKQIDKVPHALEGRDSFNIDIFGMSNVPQDILDEKQSERGEPPTKRQKVDEADGHVSNPTRGVSSAGAVPIASMANQAPMYARPNIMNHANPMAFNPMMMNPMNAMNPMLMNPMMMAAAAAGNANMRPPMPPPPNFAFNPYLAPPPHAQYLAHPGMPRQPSFMPPAPAPAVNPYAMAPPPQQQQQQPLLHAPAPTQPPQPPGNMNMNMNANVNVNADDANKRMSAVETAAVDNHAAEIAKEKEKEKEKEKKGKKSQMVYSDEMVSMEEQRFMHAMYHWTLCASEKQQQVDEANDDDDIDLQPQHVDKNDDSQNNNDNNNNNITIANDECVPHLG